MPDQTPHGDTWYFPGKFSFAWGSPGLEIAGGNKGQLGNNDNLSNQLSPDAVEYYPGINTLTGVFVGDLQSFSGHVRAVTCGAATIYQVAERFWITGGSNVHGEQGTGATDFNSHLMVPNPNSNTEEFFFGSAGTGRTLVDFSAGGDTNVAGQGGTMYMIWSDRTLFGWGHNADGQLGLGDTTQRAAITTVATDVVKVHAGGRHALYLTADGRVFSAGNNDFGQLGRGTIGVASTTWGEVAPPSGLTWIRIAAGNRASLFQASDGTIYGAGDGARHQLGQTVFLLPSSQTATPTALSGTMPTDIVEFMQAGTVSWFRTQAGELWFHGNVAGNGITGSSQLIITVSGSTLSFSQATTTDPLRVPLDLSFPTTSTYALNSPETVMCAQLAYISGNVDPFNLSGTPFSTFPRSFPFMAVIDTNGLLRTFGGNGWGQHGTGSTTFPSANREAFVSRTTFGGVNYATVGLATIHVGANGTLSRYDFGTWSGADIKVLQVNGTTVTEPSNWWLTAFDDSAWSSPVFTPSLDPPFGEPTLLTYYRKDGVTNMFWTSDPDPGHTMTLVRQRVIPPAETAYNALPGKLSHLEQGYAVFAVGPTMAAAGGPDEFDNGDQTSITNFWMGGEGVTGLSFSRKMTPGSVVVMAFRSGNHVPGAFSASTVRTRGITFQPYIGYISAASHDPIPINPLLSHGRSTVQFVG